jgi:hypothetical protein
MEPDMISQRVLGSAAAIALLLPILAPTASIAAPPHGGGPRGGGAVHFSGAPHVGGGGGWHGAGGYRRGGGFVAGAAVGAVIGGAIATAPYGYYGGPGYYYGPGYDPGYYDDQYYDQGPVVAVPAPGGEDAVAWCMQTYRSYDPRTGTYLGFDGFRHPCP